MKFKVGFLCLFFATLAQAEDCRKSTSHEEMDICFQSPNLKWALPSPEQLSAEKMRAGPSVSPELSDLEKKSGTVFCQYYFHEFFSSGSAKFLCARTTADGVLLDKDGRPVPEARGVSTKNMKLTVSLNGQTVEVGESYLLDAAGAPLIKTKKNGEQDLVKADELKVKYFVDKSQYKESGVQRQSFEIQLEDKKVSLENVFVGPEDITNNRWNEVFTEVASTRLFWALGLPADTMIPVERVVCFGCEAHPKEQKAPDLRKVSVYHKAVLERKFKGARIGEHFSFGRVFSAQWSQWPDEVRHDAEALALAANLIGYFSTNSTQNRLQCLDGQYDKGTKVCSVPVALVQDLGSTWGGQVGFMGRLKYGGNPRGILDAYKTEKVFSDPQTCRLYHSFGVEDDDGSGPSIHRISAAGLEKFKRRISVLTPDVVQALFETARFGDTEPEQRDQIRASNISERRAKLIQQWVRSFESRLDEIRQASCP